jgi:hypothetical protein
MGLLKDLAWGVKVAELIVFLWTIYPHPLVPQAPIFCRSTNITILPQTSPFSFRILEIIIMTEPCQWRSDNVFYCAQKRA